MKLGIISTALIVAASGALAQHAHQPIAPIETGQSQFAAVAEIVTLLRNDPKTDWSIVDIQALRDHLFDMDNVTTSASVERKVDGENVVFSITGDALVASSIRRMVTAHSPMLRQASGWSVSSSEQASGATMTVTVRSEVELNQVKGLGFFGLMTIGAHHQQHHQMIAGGNAPH